MATKPKEGAHGKERRTPSPSAPVNIDSPHGRRTPRSSVAGSPSKDNTTQSAGKPTPNYLKPSAKSTHDSNKPAKKPAANSQPTKPLTKVKSMDKPPSPSQTLKAQASASPKEKPLKPSSPSPKTNTSPKPNSDKTPRSTLRNGRSQPPVNTKGLKREPSVKRRETKANPTATTGTATSSHDIAEKLVNMPDEQEDKGVHEIVSETLKVEGEEQIINEIQVRPNDHVDNEPDTNENSKPEASNTSLPSEDHEEATAVQEEEEKKITDCESNNLQEVKEQGHNDEEHEDGKNLQQSEENPSTDAHEQIDRVKEVDHDDDEDGKVRTCVSDESEKEKENTENDRSDIKESDVGINEDAKEEPEKVTPKRQDSHGKNSPAYNDVIEETASKLAEKRKSKVRALVGAFETVISLQEPEGQGSPQP